MRFDKCRAALGNSASCDTHACAPACQHAHDVSRQKSRFPVCAGVPAGIRKLRRSPLLGGEVPQTEAVAAEIRCCRLKPAVLLLGFVVWVTNVGRG